MNQAKNDSVFYENIAILLRHLIEGNVLIVFFWFLLAFSILGSFYALFLSFKEQDQDKYTSKKNPATGLLATILFSVCMAVFLALNTDLLSVRLVLFVVIFFVAISILFLGEKTTKWKDLGVIFLSCSAMISSLNFMVRALTDEQLQSTISYDGTTFTIIGVSTTIWFSMSKIISVLNTPDSFQKPTKE